jgi:hypothetical protein
MEENNQKPLTLDGLIKYNLEVVFPYINEHCASKDDLKNCATKESVNDILAGQAEILKELKELKGEKDIGDAQDKRKGEVLKIHNGALKRNKILSPEETLQIDQMGAF